MVRVKFLQRIHGHCSVYMATQLATVTLTFTGKLILYNQLRSVGVKSQIYPFLKVFTSISEENDGSVPSVKYIADRILTSDFTLCMCLLVWCQVCLFGFRFCTVFTFCVSR